MIFKIKDCGAVIAMVDRKMYIADLRRVAAGLRASESDNKLPVVEDIWEFMRESGDVVTEMVNNRQYVTFVTNPHTVATPDGQVHNVKVDMTPCSLRPDAFMGTDLTQAQVDEILLACTEELKTNSRRVIDAVLEVVQNTTGKDLRDIVTMSLERMGILPYRRY